MITTVSIAVTHSADIPAAEVVRLVDRLVACGLEDAAGGTDDYDDPDRELVDRLRVADATLAWSAPDDDRTLVRYANGDVPDADSSQLPTGCECDNTHDANRTVCRWCYAHGRRVPEDPEVPHG